MLHLLDESLEAFLRAAVPLSRREIDVAFQAPDREWAATVSRPTINLYLWDVRRNLSERDLGMVTVPAAEGGRPGRRAPLPRVDCRYLVTAWTTDVRDEHSLLGATLAALLRHDVLPADYLQGAFAGVTPLPTMEVAAGHAEAGTMVSTPHGATQAGSDGTFLVTAEVGDAVSVDGTNRGQVGEAGSVELT